MQLGNWTQFWCKVLYFYFMKPNRAPWDFCIPFNCIKNKEARVLIALGLNLTPCRTAVPAVGSCYMEAIKDSWNFSRWRVRAQEGIFVWLVLVAFVFVFTLVVFKTEIEGNTLEFLSLSSLNLRKHRFIATSHLPWQINQLLLLRSNTVGYDLNYLLFTE